MTHPTFTIVTVTMNNLAGLQRTVASVQAQTDVEFEHVICDGASTDGTPEWLSKLSDRRVRWTSEPDDGIYEAMNKGLAQSQGEFVMVINSGDCLSEGDSLSRVQRHMRQTDAAWAYGGLRLTNDGGVPQGAYTFDPFRRQKFVMGLNWIPHAATVVSRPLLDRLGDYRLDYGTMADQEYLMRAVCLSEPSVITWFICDYALGGISQATTPREREAAWRRMRADSGLLWHGSLADRVVTEMLALRKPARILLRRLGEARSRR